MNPALHSLKKARCSGYILMEVMLATIIFAIAGVALAVVLSGAISAGESVQRETKATWGLESQLNEARINRLTSGTATSRPDIDGITYEKEVTLLNLKNEQNASLTGLYNIKITAHWKEQNQDMALVGQTYVYQP